MQLTLRSAALTNCEPVASSRFTRSSRTNESAHMILDNVHIMIHMSNDIIHIIMIVDNIAIVDMIDQH